MGFTRGEYNDTGKAGLSDFSSVIIGGFCPQAMP